MDRPQEPIAAQYGNIVDLRITNAIIWGKKEGDSHWTMQPCRFLGEVRIPLIERITSSTASSAAYEKAGLRKAGHLNQNAEEGGLCDPCRRRARWRCIREWIVIWEHASDLDSENFP